MKRKLLVLLIAILTFYSGNTQNTMGPFPFKKVEKLKPVHIRTSDTLNHLTKVLAEIEIDGYEGYCGIEYHGNSTLNAAKKNFDLEFRTSENVETSVSVFDLPEEEDFILLANAFDPSFMRNAIAFRIWEELGYYTPRYEYCELYLNDEYQGLYMFTEKIKVDVNRLNLGTLGYKNHWTETDPFLIHIDWENDGRLQRIGSATGGQIKAELEYPKTSNDRKDYWKLDYNVDKYLGVISQSFAGDINDYFVEGEESITERVSQNADLGSFIDYFLISEISKNPDAYNSSLYLNRVAGGKMAVGPIWDFDLAFANYINPKDDSVEGWVYKKDRNVAQERTMPAWWHQLMCDAEFKQMCYDRLWEIERFINSKAMSDFIHETQKLIKPFIIKDQNKWGRYTAYSLGSPGPIQLNFAEEINHISSFTSKRMDWIKSTLLDEPCLSPFSIIMDKRNYREVSATFDNKLILVPFETDLTGGFSYTGRYQYSSSFSYTVYNHMGEIMAEGPASGFSVEVDCEGWPSGRYYLNVQERGDYLLALSIAYMTQSFWVTLNVP